MQKFPLLALAAFSVMSVPLSAQIVAAAGEVVGITKSTPVVMRQLMNPTLRCLQRSCKLTFEKQAATLAGGSAYDSRLGGLWITNGTSLACVDVATCKFLCPAVTIPAPTVAGTKVYCTGLAYVDSGALKSTAAGPGWLFASYSSGHIGRIDTTGCRLKAQFCLLTSTFPTGYVIGGLATDDVNRRLYIVASAATAVGVTNIIAAAPIDPTLSNATPWCRGICRGTLPACSTASRMGRVTGVAHDSCTGTIYVTDGKQTLWGPVSVTASGRCTVTVRGCCPIAANSDTYTGLCLLPTPPIQHGKSCTLPSCNSCAAVMQAALVGDATLGNPIFGLGLRNAPSNTDAAAFAANAGTCTSPGVNFGFCATVRVPLGPPPPIVLLFFGLPAASGTCNRNLTITAPLPLNSALCGRPFSFQWVVRCRPTGGRTPGFGITNCLTFRVTGS